MWNQIIQQIVSPDMYLNHLTIYIGPEVFFGKLISKTKSADDKQKHGKLPSMQRDKS